MMSSQDNLIIKLMLGASVIAMTGTASIAMAQDADTVDNVDTIDSDATEPVDSGETKPVDEIVSTGIRQSLQKAQDIKYDADTFVDAITAEDIGALPDRSVAEALQRVPGVNISRFEQAADPDRFSVEGSGVIIRGLPYVRSELNGRDVFSANGGRALSFNDVSPELLGGVEVYKNVTSDMTEGGIAGTVNLVTRKPLNTPGPRIAGTIEGNIGDLANEWSPAFSILGSNTFETSAGTFGIQAGYAQSELISRTDVSQVTDPCYRTTALDAPCIRTRSVGSGGFSGDPIFDATNFPPAGTVVVPKGAGVRTTNLDRDRKAISLVGQWESNDGKWLATAEYLRAETQQFLSEFSILALVNDDSLFPVPAAGSSLTFDNNNFFQSGTLTQAGLGIPTENLRFQRDDDASTEDISFDLKWNPTERLGVNFEYQNINSDRTENGLIAAMQTYSDIFIDVAGETPDVRFLPASGGATNQFDNASQNFYWFAIDNQVDNTGKLESFRADVDYDLKNKFGFLKGARFGARWADRNRVTKSANFSNWGALSQPWTGGEIYANDTRGGISDYSSLRNPFQEFQRGNASVPVPGGAAYFFGGDNLVSEYLSGATEAQTAEIAAATFDDAVAAGTWNPAWGSSLPNQWRPITTRTNGVDGGVFTAGEISDVEEITSAFYGRVDFGSENFIGDGMVLDGNIGLRYVETTIKSDGELAFPVTSGLPNFTVACDPANAVNGVIPAFCELSGARLAEFTAAFTGETIVDNSDITFENWLPSFNAKLEVSEGVLFRVGVSKGISRPDLSLFRTGGSIVDNTRNLQLAGTLGTGPLFTVSTGNRLLRPIESWNYDASFEWYWDDVGSLTASVFLKNIDNIVSAGPTIRDLTSPSGVVATTEINGPANVQNGKLKGFELAYQDTFEFLPGLLENLGTQASYTYVDASDFSNATDAFGPDSSPFAAGLPLAGISKNTINLAGFYESEKISARLAYNWRSDYLATPRDVIFPFAPIIVESNGQLDGSFFYTVTDNLKLGVQAVNLLDEVTKTSQIFDFDGNTMPRSAIRSDRRFTFSARFEY